MLGLTFWKRLQQLHDAIVSIGIKLSEECHHHPIESMTQKIKWSKRQQGVLPDTMKGVTKKVATKYILAMLKAAPYIQHTKEAAGSLAC